MTVYELYKKLGEFDSDSKVEIYAIPKGIFCHSFTLDDIDIYEDNHGTVCIEGRER